MKKTLKYSRLSWEPELFISGGLIFTLFQVPHLLAQIKIHAEGINGLTGLNEFIVLLAFAFSVITVGFSIHLLIKALWIGIKAYEYALNNDDQIDRFNFNSKFIDDINLDYNSYSNSINKLAGLIFGTSILLLFTVFGIAIYLLLLIYVVYTFQLPLNIYWFGIIPLLVYLIDGITFNLLKRIKFISIAYYPIYKVVSLLTLSSLYRGMYYHLLANYKKYKIVILVLFLILLSYPLMIINASKALNTSLIKEQFSFWESEWADYKTVKKNYFYLDKFSEDKYIYFAAINSDYIDKDLLNLYIRQKSIDDLFNKEDLAPDKNNFQELINEKIILKIENEPVIGQWFFHYYSSINQYTLMNEIPVYHLEKGRHYLTILIPEHDVDNLREINISFWKE